jgi:hypothetical protein
MRIRIRSLSATLAATVVAVTAFVAIDAGAANAANSSAPPRPCGIKDISFYFGGNFEGLGLRTFDITLLAHSGITCSLTDTPLVSATTLSATPVSVTAGGRGGTLVLRPDSPLHTVVAYNAPDTEEDTTEVRSLTLAMPNGTSATTYFEYPGTTDIATQGGVNVTSWTTGAGLGEEASNG